MRRLLVLILTIILMFSSIIVTGCSSCSNEQEQVPQVNKDVIVNEPDFIYTIVYNSDADAIVKNAAVELQQYVKEVADIDFNISVDSNIKIKGKNKVISLGKTTFFDHYRSKVDFTALGTDGFVVKTVDNGNIYVDANTSEGVLFGVYDLLEKNFGVKFITPDVTHIPTTNGLIIYELNIVEVPAFEMRALYSRYIQTNPQFAAHMRMKVEFTYKDERFANFEMDAGAHKMLEYVPTSYFEEHNEWFWVYQGKVKDICYSHTGLLENGDIDNSLEISPVKLAIEHLYEKVIDPANNHIRYFNISQSDTRAQECCDCAKCIADSATYGRSGMVIRFVNAVSKGVKEKLAQAGISRDFGIVTFAYRWSEQAPWDYVNDKVLHDSVVPVDNVYVRIAPIYAHNYYTMQDDLQLDSVKRLFEGWKNTTDNVMIWTYATDFQGYMNYYPVYQTFGENFRLYRDMCAKYVMLQASHNEAMLWQDLMNTYIASKMLWNPDLNAEELKQEFLTYYFEDVASYVDSFIDNMDMQYAIILDESYPADQRPTMWCYTEEITNSKYYTSAFWNAQINILEEALNHIDSLNIKQEKKEVLASRINMVMLTPQYMYGLKYNEYHPEDSLGRYEFLKKFFKNCNDVGISMYTDASGIYELKFSLGYTEI